MLSNLWNLDTSSVPAYLSSPGSSKRWISHCLSDQVQARNARRAPQEKATYEHIMESSVDKHWVSALPLLGSLIVCVVPALSLRQHHQFALTHKGNYRPPNTFSIPLQLQAPVKRPDLAHTTLPHSVPQIKKCLLHHLRRRRKVPPFTVAAIAATQPQAIHLLHRRRVLGRSNSLIPRIRFLPTRAVTSNAKA